MTKHRLKQKLNLIKKKLRQLNKQYYQYISEKSTREQQQPEDLQQSGLDEGALADEYKELQKKKKSHQTCKS